MYTYILTFRLISVFMIKYNLLINFKGAASLKSKFKFTILFKIAQENLKQTHVKGVK